MNDTATLARQAPQIARAPKTLAEHIVEVISDSGEGAQRCGQSLAANVQLVLNNARLAAQVAVAHATG